MAVLGGRFAREFEPFDGQSVRIGLSAGSQIGRHGLPQTQFGFRTQIGDHAVGQHHAIDGFLHWIVPRKSSNANREQRFRISVLGAQNREETPWIG